MTERRYAVNGEIDLETASQLQTKLMTLVNATDDDLVVDCAGLEFIDSSGIAVFLRTQRLLETHGRRLTVVNLHGMPLRSFEVLGLTELLSA